MNNQIINIMNEAIDETQGPNAAVHLTWKRKLALYLLPCAAIPALIMLAKAVLLAAEIGRSLSIVYASSLN